jgi:hypothetical protein
MAILTGAIMFTGSFKSIRNYRVLYDPNTYAGEKGGASRVMIMNNPTFARTRENMSEFCGCGIAVKAIRFGLQDLLGDKADGHFTGRLMKMAKEINLRDTEGIRGQRSLFFSANRGLLQNLVINDRVKAAEMLQGHYSCSHDLSRASASLVVSGLTIGPVYAPGGATHFRVQHHLSVVSDYVYSLDSRRYEPTCLVNGKSAFGFSAYTSVLSPMEAVVVAAFPSSFSFPFPDDCTVLQCVGVEFFIRTAGEVYLPCRGGFVKVVGAF